MMSVYRRKWSWVDAEGKTREGKGWEAKIHVTDPDGDPVRITKSFKFEADAKNFERLTLAAIFSGRGTPKRNVNAVGRVKDFAPAYLEHSRLVASNKHSSVVSKNQLLRDHLIPFFGEKSLSAVSGADIDAFKLEKIKNGLSPKTVNNALTVLRNLLDLAQTRGLISSLPKVDWMRVPKSDFDFLDYRENEDSKVILAADASWRPMIAVAVYTGLRLGELLALKWEAVDQVNARLRVLSTVWRGVEGLPKGNVVREAPLVTAAVHALLARRAEALGEYVFHDQGKQLTEGQCKWPLWAACDEAGIGRRIRWHVLRHTFASTLVMRGVPLSVVQGLMGHTTIAMTQRYAHLSPKSLQTGAEALNGASPQTESLLAAALEPQLSNSSAN